MADLLEVIASLYAALVLLFCLYWTPISIWRAQLWKKRFKIDLDTMKADHDAFIRLLRKSPESYRGKLGPF